MPFVLLGLGLFASFAARDAFEASEAQQREQVFQEESQFVLGSIVNRIDSYLRNVSDLAIFSGSHDPPTQQQFSRFVNSSGMLADNDDALLFYAERVESDELAEVVARERELRAAPFYLAAERAGTGEDLALLMRSGAASDINGLPGIDLAEAPTLRAALEEASAAGQTMLVDMSTAFRQLNAGRELAQQYGYSLDGMGEQLFDSFGAPLPGDEGVGVVSVTPVYSDDTALAGWIFGEVLDRGFLAPYASDTTAVRIRVSDGESVASERSSGLPPGASADPALLAASRQSTGLLQFEISYVGTTRYRPVDGKIMKFVLLVGLALTIVISGVVALKLSFGEGTKQLESQLDISSYRALHDELTGLPNRSALTELLDRATSLPGAVAVLFIDVDRLKVINDSLGHEVGDHSLVQVAKRLRDSIGDQYELARFGGDEFVVVAEGLASAEDAEVIAADLIASLEAPINVNELELRLSASIGIATRGDSEGGQTASDLLRNADAAMYRAKKSGGACYYVFDNTVRVAVIDRLELEQEIDKAIDNHEFEAWFQPIVDVPRGQVVALEALVRWRRANGDMEMPGRFLPVAEETGQIVAIGAQVIRQACQRSAALSQEGLFRVPAMAINVSERELADPNFVERVERSIRNAGIPPQHVTIEVNENIMIDRVDAALEILRHLEQRGVRLSIDDFGTGLSSLSYFKRLSMMNELKIDRSFVTELCSSPADQAIVTAIVAMSNSLGIDIVAEGVETLDQAVKLLDLGVSRMQGYYFARPTAPAEVNALVVDFALPEELVQLVGQAVDEKLPSNQ